MIMIIVLVDHVLMVVKIWLHIAADKSLIQNIYYGILLLKYVYVYNYYILLILV